MSVQNPRRLYRMHTDAPKPHALPAIHAAQSMLCKVHGLSNKARQCCTISCYYALPLSPQLPYSRCYKGCKGCSNAKHTRSTCSTGCASWEFVGCGWAPGHGNLVHMRRMESVCTLPWPLFRRGFFRFGPPDIYARGLGAIRGWTAMQNGCIGFAKWRLGVKQRSINHSQLTPWRPKMRWALPAIYTKTSQVLRASSSNGRLIMLMPIIPNL